MSGRNVDTNELLEAIKNYKQKNPCLRLGQILSNLACIKDIDVYYLPDEVLIEELKKGIE